MMGTYKLPNKDMHTDVFSHGPQLTAPSNFSLYHSVMKERIKDANVANLVQGHNKYTQRLRRCSLFNLMYLVQVMWSQA